MSESLEPLPAEHVAPQGDPIAVRRALDRSPIASALIRPDGYFVWANESMAALLGTDISLLIGRSSHALAHEEDQPRNLEFLKGLLESESISGSVRGRFVPQSGAVVFGDLTATRIQSDEGFLDSFLIQIVDVTKEVLDDLALRESRQRLLDALDAELEGRVVFHALRDDDGVIIDMTYVEANRAACVALGLTRDQLIGRRLMEVFPESKTSGRLQEYISVMETGVPLEWTGRPVSSTGMLGTDRYLDARIFKIDDGVSFAFRDVTDRVLAEHRIAQSECELRIMIESSRDAVVRATMDGTIVYAAPSIESILGWSPKELVGHRVVEFIHEDFQSVFSLASDEMAAGRKIVNTAQVRAKDGHYVWIEASLAPIMDADAKVIGGIGVWRDISERVALTESLAMERERLRAELDSELDPHVSLIAVRDKSGKITDFLYENANQVALMYLGLTFDELRSTTLMTMFPGVAATRLRDMYAQVIEKGTPLVEDGFAYANEIFGGENRIYDLRGARLGDGLSLSWRDVTERAELHRNLEVSEARFRLLAENSTDVVMLIEEDRIQWISPSLEVSLGWDQSRWEGQSPAALVESQEVTSVLQAVHDAGTGSIERLRVRTRDSDGAGHWAEMRFGPFINETGLPVGVVGTFRIVDDEVGLEADRERLTRYDALTGLTNRGHALEHLTQLLANGVRAAVVYCDVDRIKDINDAHGHTGGDEVLRIIAQRVTSNMHASELAARVDGDEVLIVLVDIDDLEAANVAAERFRWLASGQITLDNGEQVHVTMSVGVALAQDGESAGELVERAEKAMREAKNAGRDRVVSSVGSR